MLHTEPKKKGREWMSNGLKETVTDLQKHPSRGKRVRETNRVKMTGLNRGSCHTINSARQLKYRAKDGASNDTLGDLFSNLLDTEKCIGISAGSISLILRQTCVIKKVVDVPRSRVTQHVPKLIIILEDCYSGKS